MALTDLQQATISLQGYFEAICSGQLGALDAAQSFFENDLEYVKLANDGAAATATAEFVLGTIQRRAQLVSISFVPNDATGLVASDANYASLIVQSRDGIGGAAKVLATATTKTAASGGTGNWAQWNNVAVPAAAVQPFDATNFVIPAGGLLTFQITKTGSGVVVPVGTFTARIRYL